MLTKVQKWGNSQGLRIPKALLEETHIAVGDEVDVSVEEGQIVVKPSARDRGRYNIRELVAKIPKDYKSHEENWGAPVGREEW
jgi:antitoxin MazE